MLIALNMTGVAMNSGATGVCHGAAYQLGARLGIHHGLTNAILYPYVIMYNKKTAGNKFLEVAKYSKLKNIETVNDFIKYIFTLCKNINLLITIKDTGVSEKDFLKNIR